MPAWTCKLCKLTFSSGKEREKHVSNSSVHRRKYGCRICHKGFLNQLAINNHLKDHHKEDSEDDGSNTESEDSDGDGSGGSDDGDSDSSAESVASSVQEKRHGCNLCSLRFASKYEMRKHVEDTLAHRQKFGCDICDRGFINHKALAQHVRQNHPGNAVPSNGGFARHEIVQDASSNPSTSAKESGSAIHLDWNQYRDKQPSKSPSPQIPVLPVTFGVVRFGGLRFGGPSLEVENSMCVGLPETSLQKEVPVGATGRGAASNPKALNSDISIAPPPAELEQNLVKPEPADSDSDEEMFAPPVHDAALVAPDMQTPRLVCYACNETFTGEREFLVHHMDRAGDASLHQPVWIPHPPPASRCHLCYVSFYERGSIEMHNRTKPHIERCKAAGLYCYKCNTAFVSMTMLLSHTFCKARAMALSEQQSQRQPPADCAAVVASGSGDLRCHYCNLSVSSEQILERHLRIHEPRKTCFLCDVQFDTKEKRKRHYRSTGHMMRLKGKHT